MKITSVELEPTQRIVFRIRVIANRHNFSIIKEADKSFVEVAKITPKNIIVCDKVNTLQQALELILTNKINLTDIE